MKGISPLIATVLLIAFTIGVGGLISIFATSLTTTTTGVTSNQSESLVKCAGAWLSINSVQNTTVTYSNPNSQTVTGVQLIFTNGNTVNAADQTLSPGESGVTSITAGVVNGNFGSQNSSVSLRGLCQSIVTVEGKCTNAQDCWDTI